MEKLWKPHINPFTEFMEKPANDGSPSEELFSHFKSRPENECLPQRASESHLNWYSQQQRISNFLISEFRALSIL